MKSIDKELLFKAGYKKCVVCDTIKPNSEYYEDNRNSCKECMRKANKERRERRKQERLELEKQNKQLLGQCKHVVPETDKDFYIKLEIAKSVLRDILSDLVADIFKELE